LKILVLLSRFPLPADKGDKLRAWQQIQGLAEKHQIFVFCTSDEKIDEASLRQLKSCCEDVWVKRIAKPGIVTRIGSAFLSNLPFQVAYFSSSSAIREFNWYCRQVQPDLVYCQLARMAEFVKELPPEKLAIDYQDAFSKGLERRVSLESSWKKRLVESEFIRLRAYESKIFERFGKKFIISEQDQGYIQHPSRKEIVILPNGVDVDHYRPEPSAKTIDLLFTGNMQYEPNVNCILYLVKKVFPLLKEEFPHLQLVAAGKNPTSELRNLKSGNLQLTGWIDDLRKYYRTARLFVAPMQIGIGMQNKILEAMSMGLPVITSSLANNAIGAKHGKEIWIADSPEKVAEGISYLLNNTELALRLGQSARELMLKKYSWSHQNAALINELEQFHGSAVGKVQIRK
jgi:sugar transferase (PEP-CTERM/EpsH1 system associated)